MEREVIPELVEVLEAATRKVFQKLKEKHNEKFYYFSLIVSEATTCPYPVAWSEEALERAVLEDIEEDAEDEDINQVRENLKWSFGDSPYYAYCQEFFKPVEDVIYKKRGHLMDTSVDLEEFEKEFQLRLNSMERVMANLDKEGLFGVGEERLGVFINAEIMPPENINKEFAVGLNPPQPLQAWLDDWDGEFDEEEDDFEFDEEDDDDDDDFECEEDEIKEVEVDNFMMILKSLKNKK